LAVQGTNDDLVVNEIDVRPLKSRDGGRLKVALQRETYSARQGLVAEPPAFLEQPVELLPRRKPKAN
jgi:hypothetical protein